MTVMALFVGGIVAGGRYCGNAAVVALFTDYCGQRLPLR